MYNIHKRTDTKAVKEAEYRMSFSSVMNTPAQLILSSDPSKLYQTALILNIAKSQGMRGVLTISVSKKRGEGTDHIRGLFSHRTDPFRGQKETILQFHRYEPRASMSRAHVPCLCHADGRHKRT